MPHTGRFAGVKAQQKTGKVIWCHQGSGANWRACIADWREIDLDVWADGILAQPDETASLIETERQGAAAVKQILQSDLELSQSGTKGLI